MVELDQDALWNEIDFSDIEAKYAVPEPDFFSAVVIIDNLPIVDEAKAPKLLTVLKKIISKFGRIKEETLEMPQDKDKMSKGFMFMEMESGQDAQAVVKNLDNYRLDKAHVLAVNRFADFEKFMATADEFEEPKEEPYVEKPNLGYYLVDEYARDQFAVLAGEQTQIYWNNRTIDPALVHERQAWTEAYLQWSPQGSYLTSIHKQGVALWGGEKWERVVRFAHPNVKLLDYSPGENYLITWSPELIGGKGENLRVWDIRSGKLLRGFATPENKKLDWPIFKWSPDDKLMARAAKDAIAVYELPAMTLLDGKPLKADGRQDFEWCPSVNGSDTYLIAYWTPESGNTPARVTVVDVKTKAIVRTKNFFLVSDCKLFWQNDGDYLCVKLELQSKNKKTTFTNLHVFCMREKEIPIDVFEGELKDRQVSKLAWEPNGNRLALIAQEGLKTFVGFYQMEKAEIKQLKMVERKGATHLLWSPKGRFLVIGALGNNQGEMDFWDAEELQLLNSAEHYQASELEWDPSGRYLMSLSSFWRYQSENGYNIWDFRGQLLLKKTVERCKQLLWRPRPPSLLSKEQMKQIRRKLKDYSDEFDEIDAKLTGDVAAAAELERRRVEKDWADWKKRWQERYAAQRDLRAQLRAADGEEPVYSDDEAAEEDAEIEEIEEEVVEEWEEPIEGDDEDD